ncbi:ferrous iron transport protein A [Natroniella acetigena]|uniref:FeoA family protein n=1 Tax=Natroniella acetigena TaxID=52004 RepID=UPI00200B9A52|nr:FeoA family protein [Natroniella acetigena]MCK8826671.1 ferrous iron transport protein A [Natroniella acetigena]
MFLYDLKKEQACRIEQLPTIPLLNSLGLREGMNVSIKSHQPLGGPIVIQIGRRSVAVAKDIAEEISVEKIEKNIS